MRLARSIGCALLASFVTLGACATSGSPHDLVLTSAGIARSVRVDEARMFGPDIEINRFDDGYRGRWLGRVIDVRVEGDRVRGAVDTQPVDLHITESEAGLGVRGLVAGRLGRLELSDERLSGFFGACGYDLQHVAGSRAYRGWRCGAADAVVRLPENWAARPAAVRAVLLALLLAS